MHVALPTLPNKFKPIMQREGQQAQRAYCPKIYTVPERLVEANNNP